MKPAASTQKPSKSHVDDPTTSTAKFIKKFPLVALKAALNISMVYPRHGDCYSFDIFDDSEGRKDPAHSTCCI